MMWWFLLLLAQDKPKDDDGTGCLIMLGILVWIAGFIAVLYRFQDHMVAAGVGYVFVTSFLLTCIFWKHLK